MKKEMKFEEKFPSLKEKVIFRNAPLGDGRILVISEKELEENCLDKKRVRKALKWYFKEDWTDSNLSIKLDKTLKELGI